MLTAYHPQTDGMSERVIRNVTQVLMSCIANDQSDWVDVTKSVSGSQLYGTPIEHGMNQQWLRGTHSFRSLAKGFS